MGRPARKLLAAVLTIAACCSGVLAALAPAWPSRSGLAARSLKHPHRLCQARGRASRPRSHHGLRCRRKHRSAAKKGAPAPAVGITGTPPQAGPPGTSTTPPPAPGGEPPAGGKPPAVPRVQVTAVEYGFTLSRTTVPAGKVIIELVNKGQDEHNLNVLGGEGELASSFANEISGGVKDQSVVLKAGSYTLFCSLPEHEQKGMKATLLVQ